MRRQVRKPLYLYKHRYDQEISPRRRKKDDASTKIIRKTFALLLKMDGMLIRFTNVIEKDPTSLVKDDLIFEKWKKASKMKEWLEEKKSEFDISKIDEGIKKLTDQLFEKIDFLIKFNYAEYKEPTKPLIIKSLTSFTSLTLLKAFELNPKNRTAQNMNVIETIKNRQAKEKTLDDSVISLLKDNVTAAEILKFSEKYFMRGFTIAWGLNAFNNLFAGLISNKTRCCVIDYINQLFKRGTPDFWHYTRKTIACGTDFQSMLRIFFFELVGQTLEYCITSRNDKELCILLESMKWSYSASDFIPLKKSYILEKLSPKFDCYLTSLWKYTETNTSVDKIKQKLQLILISTYDFIVMRVILRACKEKEKAVEAETTRKRIKLERYSSTIDDKVADMILKELLVVVFQEIEKKVQYNKTKPKDAKASSPMLSFCLLSIVVKICNFIYSSLEQQAKLKDIFQETWLTVLLDSLYTLDIESQYLAIKCLRFLLKLVPGKVMAASKAFISQNKEKYATLATEIENPFICIIVHYLLPSVGIKKQSESHKTAINEALLVINQLLKDDPSADGVSLGIKQGFTKWILQTVEKITPEQIKGKDTLTFDCILSLLGAVFKGLNPRTKGYYTKTGQKAEIVDSRAVIGKIYIYLEREDNEKQSGAWQSITKVKENKFIPRDDKLDFVSSIKLEEGLGILGILEKIILVDNIPAMRKAKIGKVFSVILDQREDIAKEYFAQKSQLETLLKLASVSPILKYSKCKNIVEQAIDYLPEEAEPVPQPDKKITFLKKEGEQILISDGNETYKFDIELDMSLKPGSFEIVNYDPEHANEKSKTQLAFLPKQVENIKAELYAGIIICIGEKPMLDVNPEVMLVLIKDNNNLFTKLMGCEISPLRRDEGRRRSDSGDDSGNDSPNIFSLEKNGRDNEVFKMRKQAVMECLSESKKKGDGKYKGFLQDSLGYSARHAIISVLNQNKERLKTVPKDFLVKLFECLQLVFVEADYLEKGFKTNKLMSSVVEILDILTLHPDINSQFFLFVDKISESITKEKLGSYHLFKLDSAGPIRMYFPFIQGFFQRILKKSGSQFISCKEFPSIMVLIDSIKKNPKGEILNVYQAFGMVIDILKCCEENFNDPNTPDYLSKILSSEIIKYCADYTDRNSESRLYTQIHAIKVKSDSLLEKALKTYRNATIKGEFSKHTRMEQKVQTLSTLPDLTTAYSLFYQKKNRCQQSNRTKEIAIKPLCLTGYNIPIDPKRETNYSIEKNGKYHSIIR